MKALDVIRAMQASGVDDSAILKTVITALEEEAAKARARVAKCRNNKRNRNVTNVSHVTPFSPDKERSPRPPKEITPLFPSVSSLRSDTAAATPRLELERVLDPEHAAAVIEHRQRKRSPLTSRAAKMLAKQLAKVPDPNAAADTMLARGWTGFEPEWLEPRDGKANGKTDGPVLYKFSTAEEVMADLERERRAANGG
jgi:hypothetical protein